MIKKILTFVFISLFIIPLSAREAAFYDSDYEISLKYNDVSQPGDAVFAKMRFLRPSKSSVPKEQFSGISAQMELYLGEKLLDRVSFYQLPEECSKKETVLLAGLPLSSWWKKDDGYKIKIIYTVPSRTAMEFTLPFNLKDKEFVTETLELDTRNTSIKTDTSAKRMEQIDRLNAVLKKITPASVYQTKPFTPPTPATRRTSFFADRRTYAYTNGKSSTNLHYGIDYGIPEGSEVKACAKGRVVLAEDRISTGWSVVIEHLPGLYSLYYHMSKMDVKPGDIIQQGQKIGESGATGLATGPHLHWEIRLNMSAVSPDFFTGDFAFSKF
ncbi:MAG: M23 family metallopeptidase [Treponema sp.]|nr:M23 family metallopeptidase [Treponema sp.]